MVEASSSVNRFSFNLLQGISIAYVVTAIFGVELWRFYILPGVSLTDFMRWFLIFSSLISFPVSLYNIHHHYKSKERFV